MCRGEDRGRGALRLFRCGLDQSRTPLQKSTQRGTKSSLHVPPRRQGDSAPLLRGADRTQRRPKKETEKKKVRTRQTTLAHTLAPLTRLSPSHNPPLSPLATNTKKTALRCRRPRRPPPPPLRLPQGHAHGSGTGRCSVGCHDWTSPRASPHALACPPRAPTATRGRLAYATARRPPGRRTRQAAGRAATRPPPPLPMRR